MLHRCGLLRRADFVRDRRARSDLDDGHRDKGAPRHVALAVADSRRGLRHFRSLFLPLGEVAGEAEKRQGSLWHCLAFMSTRLVCTGILLLASVVRRCLGIVSLRS